MRSHNNVDDEETKRKRMKRAAIKEILISELKHKDNLLRMIEISKDPAFREQFSDNGQLLSKFTGIAEKTEEMLNKIYRGTPWENLSLADETKIQALVDEYAPSPKKLRRLVRMVTKITASQLECTALANAFNANPAILRERTAQTKQENIAREKQSKKQKEHPTHQLATTEFRETKNPILLTQRFPRYGLLLKELNKYAGNNNKTNECLQINLARIGKITETADTLTTHLDLLQPCSRASLLESLKRWSEKDVRSEITAICAILEKIYSYQKTTGLDNNTVLLMALLKPVELMIDTKFSRAPLTIEIFQEQLEEIQASLAVIKIIAERNPQDTNIAKLHEQARLAANELMSANVNDHSDDKALVNAPDLNALLAMPLSDMLLSIVANQDISIHLQALLGGIEMKALATSTDPNVAQLHSFLEFIATCSQGSPNIPHPLLTANLPFNTAQTLRELFSNALKGPDMKYQQDLAGAKPASSKSGFFGSRNREARDHSKVKDALQNGAPVLYNALAEPGLPTKSRTI